MSFWSLSSRESVPRWGEKGYPGSTGPWCGCCWLGVGVHRIHRAPVPQPNPDSELPSGIQPVSGHRWHRLAFSAREGAPGWQCGGPGSRVVAQAPASLLGGRQGTASHGLCPVLPCFKVGCTGVCGCVCPVRKWPLGYHQRVPQSVSIPWGHRCHSLSPPAQATGMGSPE